MSEPDYGRNLKTWRTYNAIRIKRALEINPEQGRLAFFAVPYLLHTNHPSLPGYIANGEAVTGIYLYTPGEEEEKVLRRYFPNYSFRTVEAQRTRGKLAIESLLIMGSIGTVAQTKLSDFDYWVVVDETKLSAQDKTTLGMKIAAIEKWAVEQKMEAHFFITDVNKAKANDFGATDKESSGSSQALLLKEEFYRTAIMVAGKDPLWWVLPPGMDPAAYEVHKKAMIHGGDVAENDVVDLGNTSPIPLGELFGALLWQFNKAMISPHKSALKMALMESFIMAGGGAELLCDTLKKLVHDGHDSEDLTDPYLLMFERIYRFYMEWDRKAALASLEKCFFLKCFENANSAAQGAGTFKDRLMAQCIKKWAWDRGTIAEMGGFKNWDFQSSAKLASSLHGFMLEVYKNLTDRISTQPNVKHIITDTDLTVLGRKLFAIYSKKPGKIEYLKRVKDEATHLEAISFAAAIKRGSKPVWGVYKDNITSMAAKGMSIDHLYLNKGADPVELAMWLVHNRIFHKNSFLYFIPNQTPVSLKDIQTIIEKMTTLFPYVALADLKKEELMAKAKVRKILLVVNLLTDRWKKDIDTIQLVHYTSWGEYYCETLGHHSGLLRLLELLNDTPPDFFVSDSAKFDIYVPPGENQVRLKRQITDFISQKFTPLKRKALSLS
ncbi:MAG: class I adenylate cyclase [Nitrospinae bacterium]|nr:class I adenylate cyclase [Nitrospinota bacterium]